MSFDNCTEAYNAGVANIPKTSPLYGPHLDRDGDGIGCDNPPAGFTPRPTPGKPTPTTAASVGAKPQDGAALPQTGPGDAGLIGAALLAAGAAAVLLIRRRRTRFTP